LEKWGWATKGSLQWYNCINWPFAVHTDSEFARSPSESGVNLSVDVVQTDFEPIDSCLRSVPTGSVTVSQSVETDVNRLEPIENRQQSATSISTTAIVGGRPTTSRAAMNRYWFRSMNNDSFVSGLDEENVGRVPPETPIGVDSVSKEPRFHQVDSEVAFRMDTSGVARQFRTPRGQADIKRVQRQSSATVQSAESGSSFLAENESERMTPKIHSISQHVERIECPSDKSFVPISIASVANNFANNVADSYMSVLNTSSLYPTSAYTSAVRLWSIAKILGLKMQLFDRVRS